MATVAVVALFAAGCDQGQRAPGSPAIDPRRPALQSRYEPVALDVRPLVEHADYDRWEDAVEARGGPRLVHVLYQQLLTRQRGTARTFVRWVYYAHDRRLGDDVIEQLRGLVDALAARADAASDPDILFILGYMGWIRLTGGPDQATVPQVIELGASAAAVVDVVRKNWEPLTARHPDWVGPHGVGAAQVATWLRALQPADAVAVGAPGAEPPTSLGGLLHSIGTRGAKTACEGLDEVVAALPDRSPAAMASLGDAYALCALERGNPDGALEQLGRMMDQRILGGFRGVLARADAKAPVAVRRFRERVLAVVAADRAYAERAGLVAWLDAP